MYEADNAIYNYEWFKTQHQKIIVANQNIKNTEVLVDSYSMYGSPIDWDYMTKQSHQQDQVTLLGQRNYHNELVGEYNARASMSTRNIFDDKLPMHVDELLW